jgi:hypothetical protein
MTGSELEALADNEVAFIPIDKEQGLVLALGHGLDDGLPVPKGLLDSALDLAGFAGGALSSKALLDGSLVRLAPQTVSRMKDGAVFLRDADGVALGSLREIGKRGVTDQVRFISGAANPVAAGLMLQTMAVQRQLGQMQETLEAIDQKLNTVLKGVRHGKLATLVKLMDAIDELAGKLRSGHELTEVDEQKLRDYRDEAKQLEAEAKQWLHDLRSMLAEESVPLREQQATLQRLVREEHVAFWLRVYVAAEVALAHATWLLLARAAVAEPEWAVELKEQAQHQLQASATDIAGLMADLDAYLRNPDIASGWEELSLKRKRDVRALRRQLLSVHEGLRGGLSVAQQSMAEMMGDDVEIPPQLSRREVDPWLVRDGVADGGRVTWTAAKTGASGARSRVISAGNDLFQRLEDRYLVGVDVDGSSEDPAGTL